MSTSIHVNPDTAQWSHLVSDIAVQFKPGELISHSFLKQTFLIDEVDIHDFAETEDFIKRYQDLQFSYMTLVDKLRTDLLHQEQYYLENVRGLGYRLMQPNEQALYAFKMALKEIKKVLKLAADIVKHVRPQQMSAEMRAHGQGLSAKLSLMQQMFNTIKR